MEKEKKFNDEELEWETEFGITLNDYELYVIKDILDIRMMQIAAARDKCGISAEDGKEEPNKHIQVIKKLAKELQIDLYVKEENDPN